jgi:indoleamine 2,3-dioxygenase
MAAAGLPRGVFYDEGNGNGQWRQYSGASNAQSSLIQLLDIVLGVEHCETGELNILEAQTRFAKAKTTGFILVGSGASEHHSDDQLTYPIQEMRRYMPDRHREFLDHVSRISNVRQYASSPGIPSSVPQAYNEAIDALVSFRNIHVQMVAKYIITPSRGPPASYITSEGALNLATASSTTKENRQLAGTGGTKLIPFLKRTRDETAHATVPLSV